jgi:hypothetical protein
MPDPSPTGACNTFKEPDGGMWGILNKKQAGWGTHNLGSRLYQHGMETPTHSARGAGFGGEDAHQTQRYDVSGCWVKYLRYLFLPY